MVIYLVKTGYHKGDVVMKSYTEGRIELGQDINNAWSLVRTHTANNLLSPSAIEKMFREYFVIVRRLSNEAREEEEARR